MIQLDTRPRAKHLIPEYDNVHICLVGIGGTGSAVAPRISQLCYHLMQQGINCHITLIDHDIVEHKNIGRQQFAHSEIGQHKASVMAQRLSAWLAIPTDFIPLPVPDAFEHLTSPFDGHREMRILISGVDNWMARQAITDWMTPRDAYWIDAGNSRYAGSVFVGNGSDYSVDPLGLVTALPWPTLQMPALLQPPQIVVEQHDCALGMAIGEQSLCINTVQAAIVMQYAADLLIRRQLTTLATHTNLSPIGASSDFMYTNLTLAEITEHR